MACIGFNLQHIDLKEFSPHPSRSWSNEKIRLNTRLGLKSLSQEFYTYILKYHFIKMYSIDTDSVLV